MKTLLDRSQAVTEVVLAVNTTRKHQHARARLMERTQEWANRRDKLAAAHRRAEWIQLRAKDVAAYAQRNSQLVNLAAEAVDRLASGEDVVNLTQDPLWKRLLNSAEGAAEELDRAVQTAWRAVVDSLGTLEAPSTLEVALPQTPANRQAMEAYKSRFLDYRKLSEQTGPRSADDKEKLSLAVSKCREALAAVQRDVPMDVKEFFRAIDAYSATLVHVTPSVLRWLEENGQLPHFQVRIAGK